MREGEAMSQSTDTAIYSYIVAVRLPPGLTDQEVKDRIQGALKSSNSNLINQAVVVEARRLKF